MTQQHNTELTPQILINTTPPIVNSLQMPVHIDSFNFHKETNLYTLDCRHRLRSITQLSKEFLPKNLHCSMLLNSTTKDQIEFQNHSEFYKLDRVDLTNLIKYELTHSTSPFSGDSGHSIDKNLMHTTIKVDTSAGQSRQSTSMSKILLSSI